MRKASFLRGALILVAGSLASRGLGAVYRFVLPSLMGGGEQAAYGMGLFGMAYPIYTVILNLSAVGVPLAISKLVAEHEAKGDHATATRVFRVAFRTLAVAGLVFSLLLAWLAKPYASHVTLDPNAAYSILAIAPAILFASLEIGYRGFFQGMQHMAPQSVSQVVEQIVRVLTMFALAVLLLPYGIQYAAAGASFGAVTGAVGGLIYLAWSFRRDRIAAPVRTARPAPVPAGRVLKQIAYLAVPISLAGIVLPLMNLMDAAVVPLRLHAAGFGTTQSTSLYGVLTGFAMPFIVAPTILTSALAVSLLPSMSSALAQGDRTALQDRAAAGLRVTLLVLLPSAIGLIVLGRQIPLALWRSQPLPASEAGLPLMLLAPAVLFIGLQQVTSGMLQGLGFPNLPMFNLIGGAVVKFAITWWLVARPAVNVSGAAVGTTLAFLVASALNVASLQARIGRPLRLGRLLLGPAVSAAVMAVAVRFVVVGLHPLGLRLATGGAIVAGVAVYGLALMLVGSLRARDVELLPRYGPALARLLRRCGLVRD